MVNKSTKNNQTNFCLIILTYYFFNLLVINLVDINPKIPPIADIAILIKNKSISILPFFVIDQGLKPNLPKAFKTKILPKTPIIDFLFLFLGLP